MKVIILSLALFILYLYNSEYYDIQTCAVVQACLCILLYMIVRNNTKNNIISENEEVIDRFNHENAIRDKLKKKD